MSSERMVQNLGTLTLYRDSDAIGRIEKLGSGDEDEEQPPPSTLLAPKTPEYYSETQALLAGRRGTACPDPESHAISDTSELLGILIPSNEWIEETENEYLIWKQSVCSESASRDQVIRCTEELKERMKIREAKETGICPIRRELYSEVFDEIIRQVTIGCPERGLLLARVRDELRMTIDAWKSLYESTRIFGKEQVKQTTDPSDEDIDAIKLELEKKMQEIENKKIELTDFIQGVDDELALKEIKFKEQFDAENRKQVQETEFLKRIQQQYIDQHELFAGENPHFAKKAGRMMLFTKESKLVLPEGK